METNYGINQHIKSEGVPENEMMFFQNAFFERKVSLADILIDFLKTIKGYELESGKSIYEDARSDEEFVQLYFKMNEKPKTMKRIDRIINREALTKGAFSPGRRALLMHPEIYQALIDDLNKPEADVWKKDNEGIVEVEVEVNLEDGEIDTVKLKSYRGYELWISPQCQKGEIHSV
jgi:hypothetical protein